LADTQQTSYLKADNIAARRYTACSSWQTASQTSLKLPALHEELFFNPHRTISSFPQRPLVYI